MFDLANIPEVREGQKISEPGVYRMGMEIYHGNVCAGRSVSSSGLRTVELQCPAAFWATSIYNPKAFGEPRKEAFSFGSAAHCVLLGDEVFKDHYAVRPLDFKDWRTKASQEWREAQILDGKTVITEADLTHIINMASVLKESLIADALMSGVIEASLVWKDDETGLWCKARPDTLPLDGVLADFKTATEASPRACQRSITNYGYDMQLALAGEGYERLFGHAPQSYAIVFQETTAPYAVTPMEIGEDAIYWAKCRNRRALRTIANCFETGVWPGYVEGIPIYHIPEWLATRLQSEQESGLLPNL